MSDFWGEPIHTYTRAEALEDGILVDVSGMAAEAGFRYPVAITAAVGADVSDRGEREGRLWDLLWMARHAIIKTNAVERQERRLHGRSDVRLDEIVYSLIMPVGGANNYRAKLHIGPADGGEYVVTIMRPEED